MNTGLPDHYRTALLVVFTIGLAIRLLFIATSERPLFSDQAEYHSLAVTLSEQGEYLRHGLPTAYRPVGYPLFLAAVYSAAGQAPLFARLLQGLADSLTGVLLFLLGSAFNRAAAIFAATLWLFFPPAILFSNLLLSETFTVLFLVLGAYVFLGALQSRNSFHSFVLGLVLGLATLLKPWIALAGLFVFVSTGRTKPMSKAVVCLVGFLLIVLPWLVRNAVVLGTPALSTNTGINLYIGNNPGATGAYRSQIPGELLKKTEVDQNREAFFSATKYILENPGQFVVNGGKKLAHLFRSETEILVWSFSSNPTDPNKSFSDQYRSLPLYLLFPVNGPTFVILLLGFLGFLSWDKSPIRHYFLILLIVTIAIHFVFFGGSRFHFVLMPFFTLYAAYAISEGRYAWKRLPIHKTVLLGIACVSISFVWFYEYFLV